LTRPRYLERHDHNGTTGQRLQADSRRAGRYELVEQPQRSGPRDGSTGRGLEVGRNVDAERSRCLGALQKNRLNTATVGNSMSNTENPVRVEFELAATEAWDLAQFLKRVGFKEFRDNAVDEDEAYRMRDAAARVARALAAKGFAPR
jgi:hypothetical protein